jgi:secreted PhoX family phosphatase
LFRHEAAVADPTRNVLYLSEDEPDGLLYRFRPRIWGDLSEGDLDALVVSGDGSTSWVPVGGRGEPGRSPMRYDAPGATALPGCEGIVLDGDILYLSTKYDGRISRLDLAQSRLTLYWEGPPLWGPDNLAVQDATGNLFVCEDGDDMEVVLITPDGHADPFLRFVGHDMSEVTGAAFDPTGKHFIVNSQRAPTPGSVDEVVTGEALGSTYMITGPF